MSTIKHVCRTLALGAVAALALAVPRTAAGQTPSREDPVYELQQALQVRTIDLEDPQALQNREKTLKKVIEQLHTVSELRRALLAC